MIANDGLTGSNESRRELSLRPVVTHKDAAGIKAFFGGKMSPSRSFMAAGVDDSPPAAKAMVDAAVEGVSTLFAAVGGERDDATAAISRVTETSTSKSSSASFPPRAPERGVAAVVLLSSDDSG